MLLMLATSFKTRKWLKIIEPINLIPFSVLSWFCDVDLAPLLSEANLLYDYGNKGQSSF